MFGIKSSLNGESDRFESEISAIDEKADFTQMSLISEIKNCDPEQKIITHSNDTLTMTCKFLGNCLKFTVVMIDIEANTAKQYEKLVTETNIAPLFIIYDDIEEIVDDIIINRKYKIEDGVIQLKYQVSKKNKIVTKSFKIQMNRILLDEKEQIVRLIDKLKSNLKNKNITDLQDKIQKQQAQINQLKEKLNKYPPSQQVRLAENVRYMKKTRTTQAFQEDMIAQLQIQSAQLSNKLLLSEKLIKSQKQQIQKLTSKSKERDEEKEPQPTVQDQMKNYRMIGYLNQIMDKQIAKSNMRLLIQESSQLTKLTYQTIFYNKYSEMLQKKSVVLHRNEKLRFEHYFPGKFMIQLEMKIVWKKQGNVFSNTSSDQLSCYFRKYKTVFQSTQVQLQPGNIFQQKKYGVNIKIVIDGSQNYFSSQFNSLNSLKTIIEWTNTQQKQFGFGPLSTSKVPFEKIPFKKQAINIFQISFSKQVSISQFKFNQTV